MTELEKLVAETGQKLGVAFGYYAEGTKPQNVPVCDRPFETVCDDGNYTFFVQRLSTFEILIDFGDFRARLSTIDFQKFYRLSTFRVRIWSAGGQKNTPIPGELGYLFCYGQMSYVIFYHFSGFRAGC